jgi:hypothetical protein
MVNVLLEPVGVMHRDGSSRIVSDDVPLSDAMLQSDALDLIGEHFQLVGPATVFVTALRSSPEAGQIDSHASETAEQPVDNPAPKLAAGRYAVYEQDRKA